MPKAPDDLILPEPTRVPTAPSRGVNLGGAYVTLDTSDVDKMIARLERSIAAFKAEWSRK